MNVILIILFICGYIFIALEKNIGINKTASALLTGLVMWTVYSLLATRPASVVNTDILIQIGGIAEILFYLIGAMTIVETIHLHGGFSVLNTLITTRNRIGLLWIISLTTFFTSAVLDNLTTTIVMIMIMHNFIEDSRQRWLFCGLIVIAANSGGAWSPIGDVTTIMLWMKGNISSTGVIEKLFLPCLVSVVLPLAIVSFKLRYTPDTISSAKTQLKKQPDLRPLYRIFILITGMAGLLLVPVFKALTGLPPFIGILIALTVLWISTEILYNRSGKTSYPELRVAEALQKTDLSTILFFLGILMAVAVLGESGILHESAIWIQSKTNNATLIDVVLGLLSSVIDNVPLTQAAIDMYPVTTTSELSNAANAANASFLQNFVPDGNFWLLLSFCCGTGGSLLVFGSSSGVIAMGMEKISFGWYLKQISLLALIGYAAGIGLFLLL